MDVWWNNLSQERKRTLRLLLADHDYARARRSAFALSPATEEEMLEEWKNECTYQERILSEMSSDLLQLTDPISHFRVVVKNEARALPRRHDLTRSGIFRLQHSSPNLASPDFVFLHFNDAYAVEEGKREPIGGVARFTEAVLTHKRLGRTICTFGGDLFSPSLLSSITQGQHMISFVNNMGIQAACVGNHDFDHGEEQFRRLAAQCIFPWLATNMLDVKTRKPFGGCRDFHIVTVGAIRVGIVGIIEREWISTLVGKIDINNVEVEDPASCCQRYAQMLRAPPHSCSFVVAITHMREQGDASLSLACPDVDLILGGHDHHVVTRVESPLSCPIVKAGCDFHYLSEVEVFLNSAVEGSGGVVPATGDEMVFVNARTRVRTVTRQLEVTASVSPNPRALELMERLAVLKARKLQQKVAFCTVPIDVRASSCRTQEAAMGNFLADVMMSQMGTSFALLNGGSIRSDQIVSARSYVTVELIMSIFPFEDPVVVVEVSGSVLRAALENGVSKLPASDGRFLQVGGLCYQVDLKQPPMKRIVSVRRLDTNAPITDSDVLNVAVPFSMATGLEDSPLKDCRRIVDKDDGVLPSLLLRTFLQKRQVVQALLLRTTGVTRGAQRALAKFQGANVLLPRLTPKLEGRIKFL